MKNIKQDETKTMSKTLPLQLKVCREKSGLSMREVAKRINKTAATICKWESGEVTPYGDMLLKLCELYGVDITTFFGLETENKMRLTSHEMEIINLYRNATRHAQITVHTVLETCQKTNKEV